MSNVFSCVKGKTNHFFTWNTFATSSVSVSKWGQRLFVRNKKKNENRWRERERKSESLCHWNTWYLRTVTEHLDFFQPSESVKR